MFHLLGSKELYEKVNHLGTLNVIEACRAHNIQKLVMSSSPSTRFTGEDVDGLTEEEMPQIPLKAYLQVFFGFPSYHMGLCYDLLWLLCWVLKEYAASKARGELVKN